jgi:hypothetical protein
MSLDQSAASFLFRQLYSDGIDQEALVRNKPFMQWTKNKTDFTNNTGIKIPAPYVNPQGIAATNAGASSAEVASAGVVFTIPQRHHYAMIRLDADVVRNTVEGGEASQFTNLLTREVDGVTEAIGVEVAQRMYGESTAIRSLTLSTGAINSTTWFLANPEDAQFYEVNMKIVLVNPATGLARVGTAVTVQKVNPIVGTLICSGNPDSFTSAAAGDGIARDTFVGVDFDGLKGWVPTTVSVSDSFLGVNRSVYTTRLAGCYVDGSQMPIRNAFIKALAVAKAQVGTMFESKSPFFINPKNMAQILQTVEQTKVNAVELDDKYGIGLEGVECLGHKFIEDSLCPVNECFMVGKNAWIRATCGKQPQIDTSGDGQEFWYNRSTGKIEAILAHDGGTGAVEPYNLLRLTLPNVAL